VGLAVRWCRFGRHRIVFSRQVSGHTRFLSGSGSLVLALRLLAHFGRRTGKYDQHLQTKKKTTSQVSHVQSQERL
jgi:hypothetical protein